MTAERRLLLLRHLVAHVSQALLQHVAPLGIVAASLHVTRWCLAGFLPATAAADAVDATDDDDQATENDGADRATT